MKYFIKETTTETFMGRVRIHSFENTQPFLTESEALAGIEAEKSFSKSIEDKLLNEYSDKLESFVSDSDLSDNPPVCPPRRLTKYEVIRGYCLYDNFYSVDESGLLISVIESELKHEDREQNIELLNSLLSEIKKDLN